MSALPPALARAIEACLEGVGRTALSEAALRLSSRYRAGPGHATGGDETLAYLATRLPATYAATSAALSALAQRCPDLAPRSLLDLGAGPATASWAALDIFPTIDRITLVERDGWFRERGQRLAAEGPAPLGTAHWVAADLERGLPDLGHHDLVIAGFALAEIAPSRQADLVTAAWGGAETLLLVEPGTPAGFARIVEARTTLLAAGASLASPCPHPLSCPLIGTADWCHASVRLPRSRVHRDLKGADLAFEDEKFSHVAFSRAPVVPVGGWLLYPPRRNKVEVAAFVCEPDGSADWRHIKSRDRAAYKAATKWQWGQVVP